MSKIQLTNKYEIESDDTNNRLIIRLIETGQEFYLNEDGTISGLTTPANDDDAATKAYADSIAQGLDIKESVRVATTADVDLTSSADPGAIDGVTLADGDRILLKDQTTAAENGVYDAVTAADPSTWVRADDVDEDVEVDAGMFVFVSQGTESANQGFVLVSDDPLVVGTDDLQFTQFSGTGSQPGIYTSVSTQTGNYTAADGDLVLADASSGAFTVTLPAPSEGDAVAVKKIDSSANDVTIATPGAETIDGHSTITISAQFASRDFVSDGTNYFMV